jgi:putative ABC transport system ATP-binding protein
VVSPPQLLAIADARFRWPGRAAFGLSVRTLAMAPGERVLLIGPSGSGKSTLLALIAGIVTPDAGEVRVLGTNIGRLDAAARDRFRAEHMGVVFQMFNLLAYGTAIDNILLPLSFAPLRRARVGDRATQQAEARRLLARLGLDPEVYAGKKASALSVGQQQRVAAARALIGGPDLIIADEPTSALDPEMRDQFLELTLAEIRASRGGLLMVSHDPALSVHFDRVVRLADILAAPDIGTESRP